MGLRFDLKIIRHDPEWFKYGLKIKLLGRYLVSNMLYNLILRLMTKVCSSPWSFPGHSKAKLEVFVEVSWGWGKVYSDWSIKSRLVVCVTDDTVPQLPILASNLPLTCTPRYRCKVMQLNRSPVCTINFQNILRGILLQSKFARSKVPRYLILKVSQELLG